jgi:phage shock protein C
MVLTMKKLYKVEQGKMLCGVCGGIAEYFDVDPSLVRIGWVLLTFFAGSSIIAYIIAAIILPNKSEIL